MKKGLREDKRKQKEIIKTQIATKLHKIPQLAGIAYMLAEKSKDVTSNTLDQHLETINYAIEIDLDAFDKQLILGEYNRIIVSKNEQGNK